MEETLNTTFDIEEPKQKRSRGKKKSSEPKKVILKKSLSEPVESMSEANNVITADRKLKKSLSEQLTVTSEVPKKVVVAARKLKKSSGFTVESIVTTKAATPVSIPARKSLIQRTPSLKSSSTTTETNLNTPPLIRMPSTPSTLVKSVKKTLIQPLSNIPKRKAAPNFAEIHQKNFDKMQSVEEYVEKKKLRTENIVTGSALKNKLNGSTATQTPAKTPATKSLKFNFVSGKKLSHFVYYLYMSH